MSTYKVIQDVEAEDKLLGPLTLRQFIYAGVAAVSLYLCYFLATHGLGFMLIVFLPIALVAGFFAFPWGRDQPTEIWALAKIRFMVKPRRRIWNQDGIKELVTITAPKQLQVNFTNGLSQTEVHSRLHALADTIDSRGWAIKNANLNMFGQPALVMAEPNSDRLLQPTTLPQQDENVDIQASDDILDEKNNSRAQRVDSMIVASEKAHRQKIMDNLRSDKPEPAKPAPNNYWFLNQPAQAANVPSNMVTFNTQVVTPGTNQPVSPAAAPVITKTEEENLVHELEAHQSQSPTSSYYGHLHTIQPLSAQVGNRTVHHPPQTVQQPAPVQPVAQQAVPMPPPLPPTPVPTPPPVTPTTQAAILNLASNDDLNVATIAREANRTSSNDEVVIKLH